MRPVTSSVLPLGTALIGTVLVAASIGCTDPFLPEEPGDGPLANFEYVWSEVDRHYSFFELKEVDWDEIHDEFRLWVRPHTKPAELFGIISGMLDRLRDGHVGLQAPFEDYQYSGWYRPYSHNFNLAHIWNSLLLRRGQTPSGKILFGHVRENIGYIYIPSFTGTGWVGEMDQVLENLAGVDVLVVDVRDNLGGKESNAEKIAGRFASERTLYRRIQYRNGPAHTDFGPLEDGYLEPTGLVRFLGPVAVLTNRRTFSAAESFVLAMRSLPNVTIVGDMTGGGSGNPLSREMPNGWTFTVSRWIEWAPDGTTHEGVGLAPDVPAQIPDQLLGFADPILQVAIQHLLGEIF